VLASSVHAAEPVRLAAHRAIYDLSLVKGGGARGVEAAQGRIVIEFTGNPCEGYTSKYRQFTVLESGETGSKTSDMRNATFEDDAGKSFRFRTDSNSNGKSETVDGDAATDPNGAIALRLKQPAPHRQSLPNGTLFPKDGRTGMRTVRRSTARSPILRAWFERHRCAAAIVRPDHYVYGVAGSNAALDRQLEAMAKQLA
jgi:hypothetical protein